MQPKPKTIRECTGHPVIEALGNEQLRAMAAAEYPPGTAPDPPVIGIEMGDISETLFSDLKRQIRVMNLEYLIEKSKYVPADFLHRRGEC